MAIQRHNHISDVITTMVKPKIAPVLLEKEGLPVDRVEAGEDGARCGGAAAVGEKNVGVAGTAKVLGRQVPPFQHLQSTQHRSDRYRATCRRAIQGHTRTGGTRMQGVQCVNLSYAC